MLELMARGGDLMWVILFLTAAGVGLVLERTFVLLIRFRLNSQKLYDDL